MGKKNSKRRIELIAGMNAELFVWNRKSGFIL